MIIEVSDDSSDSTDLQVLQTIEPKIQKPIDPYDILFIKFLFHKSFLEFKMHLSHFNHDLNLLLSMFICLFTCYFIISCRFQSSFQAPVRQPPIPQTKMTTSTQTRILRHIVLDGQNIARK